MKNWLQSIHWSTRALVSAPSMMLVFMSLVQQVNPPVSEYVWATALIGLPLYWILQPVVRKPTA